MAQKTAFSPAFHSHFRLMAEYGGTLFCENSDERIRRGVFKSTLQDRNIVTSKHTINAKPFVWTKTADEIINKLKPVYQMTNNTMY